MMKPDNTSMPHKRLVIVSNRLPVSLVQQAGKWQVVSSAGGLVTAMGPVLRNRGGLWIGWPGTIGQPNLNRLLLPVQSTIGYSLLPVNLTQAEHDGFYYGFSNEIIWPLFHSLQSLCNYDPGYWSTYQTVNRNYADVVVKAVGAEDNIWIHDYHLMILGRYLREASVASTLGFFLHIPFPPPDIFQKLPWRENILKSLMEFDLLGFQTARYKRNFLNSLRMLVKDVEILGKGLVNRIRLNGKEVLVGNFPIGIDYKSFAAGAVAPEVETRVRELRAAFPDCRLILGVDRLDYTKGIPYKLQAFRRALIRYPELRKKVTLLQIVVPSREDIPQYYQLKAEIEQLVGEINGELAEPGWAPIHYMFRSVRRTELLAYYRAADVGLVTPLEDGMNLVAKEFCASSDSRDTVLILSEFAGAAAQLRGGALLVNPYDLDGVADAIHTALEMNPEERRSRMRKQQRAIREQDIFWWVDAFLKAGTASFLQDFPMMGEALPMPEADTWWEGA